MRANFVYGSRAARGLNRLSGYEWVFIKDLSERQTAAVLADSLIFLFLSTIEGFGRMPIEAMLSGSVVCAYGIEPLTEYLAPDNALLAPAGDVLAVVDAIERIVERFETAPQSLAPLTGAAARSASRFTPLREQESVVRAWNAISSGAG